MPAARCGGMAAVPRDGRGARALAHCLEDPELDQTVTEQRQRPTCAPLRWRATRNLHQRGRVLRRPAPRSSDGPPRSAVLRALRVARSPGTRPRRLRRRATGAYEQCPPRERDGHIVVRRGQSEWRQRTEGAPQHGCHAAPTVVRSRGRAAVSRPSRRRPWANHNGLVWIRCYGPTDSVSCRSLRRVCRTANARTGFRCW